MHDTILDFNKRIPPLIVLGLTGPVGSGCTTVSSAIFDDPANIDRERTNQLLRTLNFVKWVNLEAGGKFAINWKDINNRLDQMYGYLDSVGKALEKGKSSTKQEATNQITEAGRSLIEDINKTLSEDLSQTGDLKEDLQIIHEKLARRLKDDLETRETLKALDKLNAYYRSDTHLFRTISVSDLIVYRAMMAIEGEGFSLDKIVDVQKKKKYKRFVDIAEAHMDRKPVGPPLSDAGVEGYVDYWNQCYAWENRDKLEELGKVFFAIHGVASKIKNGFYRAHPYDYGEVMQDFGDNIRQHGDPFCIKPRGIKLNAYKLAKGIAQMIYVLYKTRQGAFFIVDCLRNPYEVIYLRKEFANFFLLSLYADKPTRKKRFLAKAKRILKDRFDEKRAIGTFERIDERDSGKNITGNEVLYKQNVTKCVQVSDITIHNTEDLTKPEDMEERIQIFRKLCRKPLRALCLILSPGCTKPNDSEMCMNMANIMAVKSNCISRQVGAVIIGPNGYIVGAGWNDVGEAKISCGLRAIRDLRCAEFVPHVEALLRKGGPNEISKTDIELLVKQLCSLVKGEEGRVPPEQFCFCFKDEMAKRIVARKIKEGLNTLNKTLEKTKIKLTDKLIEKLVAKAEVHQLEYCLALHAEENAIIQSSKIGGMGLKGGTIYTTAEPCALCAKKIQQIGLTSPKTSEAFWGFVR